MSTFKLVLLDYAKEQLENPLAQKILSDMITVKQKNFERTDANYVVVDKHDMIGTHALVYETSTLYSPKLIFALRLTYEDRALQHKLRTPIQELIPQLDEKYKEAYADFKKRHPVLADCNSWFVDTEYSLKNSGLRLSDIGYTMVFLQAMRMGLDHILGCTNEKYKAHRWLEKIGSFDKGYEFIHPVVPDPHMFIMIEKFNFAYIQSVYESNKTLFDDLQDVIPASAGYKSIKETIEDVFGESSKVLSLERLKKAA